MSDKLCPLNLEPEELMEFTAEWTGERFADGRPRVPEAILERVRAVTITQV